MCQSQKEGLRMATVALMDGRRGSKKEKNWKIYIQKRQNELQVLHFVFWVTDPEVVPHNLFLPTYLSS